MLQDFINQYNGQKIGDGQCVILVETFYPDLPRYPSAKDYWTAIPGYTQHTDTPQEADIAVYGPHGIYTDGHMALYAGNGEVFEQNADPDGSPAHLFNRSNTYLLGYLRKEQQMSPLDLNGARILLFSVLGLDGQGIGTAHKNAELGECDDIAQQYVGQDTYKVMADLWNSQQAQDFRHKEIPAVYGLAEQNGTTKASVEQYIQEHLT